MCRFDRLHDLQNKPKSNIMNTHNINEKKAVELYGVVTKIDELFGHEYIFRFIEDKTGIEWQVAVSEKDVNTELEIGLHVFVQGTTTILCKNAVIATYVGEWGRICSHCGKHHEDGYYSENTGLYACSDECLHELYTEEEITEEREYDWLFWTEWYN